MGAKNGANVGHPKWISKYRGYKECGNGKCASKKRVSFASNLVSDFFD